MKLIYKTEISYYHRIENEPDLVDKSCTSNHYHSKAKLVVKLPVTESFLDFKQIKSLVQIVCEKYEGQNITDKHQLETAEEFITALSDDMRSIFGRPVDVELWETDKYGMELVSNQ